ncbi:MAG: hypothetical protein V3V14_08140 [Saprospiraceae bacterium]
MNNIKKAINNLRAELLELTNSNDIRDASVISFEVEDIIGSLSLNTKAELAKLAHRYGISIKNIKKTYRITKIRQLLKNAL